MESDPNQIEDVPTIEIKETETIQPADSPSIPVSLIQSESSPADPAAQLFEKDSTETLDFYNMRTIYAKVALTIFPQQINVTTASLIGRMAANKAIYGIVYPEESDRIIQYIDRIILESN